VDEAAAAGATGPPMLGRPILLPGIASLDPGGANLLGGGDFAASAVTGCACSAARAGGVDVTAAGAGVAEGARADGAGIPDGFASAGRREAGRLARTALSNLTLPGTTNMPWLGWQSKYLTPLTLPSFFPVASSSSTPTQVPSRNCTDSWLGLHRNHHRTCVGPTKRTTPFLSFSRSTRTPTLRPPATSPSRSPTRDGARDIFFGVYSHCFLASLFSESFTFATLGYKAREEISDARLRRA